MPMQTRIISSVMLRSLIVVSILLASNLVLTMAADQKDTVARQQAARRFSDAFLADWKTGSVSETIDRWFIVPDEKERQLLEAGIREMDEKCGRPVDAEIENGGLAREKDESTRIGQVHEFIFKNRATTSVRGTNTELVVDVARHTNGKFSIGIYQCGTSSLNGTK
ncbi:MAG: hypothetical protein WA609_14430 [Terriglobales bacterium]